MRTTVAGPKGGEGYQGAFNTNSMILDITMPIAAGEKFCFRSVGQPEPGTMIVCKSGSPGHTVGHVGTVVGYKLAEWDASLRECWEDIEVVDVAGRPGRANKRTTGLGWRGTGALFLKSVMQPSIVVAARASSLRCHSRATLQRSSSDFSVSTSEHNSECERFHSRI